MTEVKTYRDDVMAAIHESAEGLYGIGMVDKTTMREFDELCLAPVRELTPEEIRAIREREHVSQTVFAHRLNVSKSLVSQWERGEKRPAGPSLKLLSLVERKGLGAIR
ncbi:MAG: helix-turn-helix domain-containing protein [Thermomicrobiales bacterium]